MKTDDKIKLATLIITTTGAILGFFLITRYVVDKTKLEAELIKEQIKGVRNDVYQIEKKLNVSYKNIQISSDLAKLLEVIPKPALMAKMRTFFRQQGGRNSNSYLLWRCRPTPPGGKKSHLQPK